MNNPTVEIYERDYAQPASPDGPLCVLIFEVGGQRYALPMTDVVEVVRAVIPVPFPGRPGVVEGVVNLRGRVVPVLDLRSRFELPSKATELSDHLIVARSGPRVVAVRADRALTLTMLRPEKIEQTSACTSGGRYVAGVAALPDGLVIIHNLETFLSEPEIEQLDAALENTPEADEV